MRTQQEKDERITQLHQQANKHWAELEEIIDGLKELGPHSQDGNNALANIRDWLSQLAQR